MAYGTIKVDTITFTDAGIDKSVAISGLVQNPTFTGNVTVTGTVSGATANFVSGVFTTQISGATVTGGNANFTSGTFTNISGGVYTITSGVFALGTSGTPSISFASDPNTGIYSPGADQVAISTSGTGRISIKNWGGVLFGNPATVTQDTGYVIHVEASNSTGVAGGGIRASCGGGGDANYFSNSPTIGYHFYGAGASSKIFYVENNGDVKNSNNSYGAVSDQKLKQDIEDAASQWQDIKSLRVRKFRFKTNPDEILQIGLIAQEVEQICPGLIGNSLDRDENGKETGEVTKSVKYSVLYMKAVKALQEAMERIETLEAKVAALEGV